MLSGQSRPPTTAVTCCWPSSVQVSVQAARPVVLGGLGGVIGQGPLADDVERHRRPADRGAVDDALVVDRLAQHQHRQLDRRPDERRVGRHARRDDVVGGGLHLQVELAVLGAAEEEHVVVQGGQLRGLPGPDPPPAAEDLLELVGAVVEGEGLDDLGLVRVAVVGGPDERPGTMLPSASTTRPAIEAFPPPRGRVVEVGLPVTAIGWMETWVRSTGVVVVVVSPVFGAGRALPSCLEQPARSGSSNDQAAQPGRDQPPHGLLREGGGHRRRLASVPPDDDVGRHLDLAPDVAQRHHAALGSGHRRQRPHLLVAHHDARSGGRGGVNPDRQAPQQPVDVAPGVDPAHQLLAEEAALGERHGVELEERLLGDRLLVDVEPLAGDAGPHPGGFEGRQAGGGEPRRPERRPHAGQFPDRADEVRPRRPARPVGAPDHAGWPRRRGPPSPGHVGVGLGRERPARRRPPPGRRPPGPAAIRQPQSPVRSSTSALIRILNRRSEAARPSPRPTSQSSQASSPTRGAAGRCRACPGAGAGGRGPPARRPRAAMSWERRLWRNERRRGRSRAPPRGRSGRRGRRRRRRRAPRPGDRRSRRPP